jgi:hypothetical protein
MDKETRNTLIDVPIGEEEVVSFDISSWSGTKDYVQIGAEIRLNIETNALFFLLKNTSDYSDIDAASIRSSFSKMCPHVQLYCPNQECRYRYTIASDTLQYKQDKSGWFIFPPKLWYESFVTGNLWVQNDYIGQESNIFSRDKIHANPITSKLLNFQTMDKDRLLNRVKTLIVFS